MPFFYTSTLLLSSLTWRRHMTTWWYGTHRTLHCWNLRDQLPLCYMVQFSIQHFAAGTNTTASQSMGVHFHQFLLRLYICLLRVIPNRLSNSILGKIPPPNVWFARLVRGATSAITYCWSFAELLYTYLDHTVVCTDGLFVQESTGSAFIYDDQVFSYFLHNLYSVYTSKFCAILWAVLFILHRTWQYHLICTHSLSTLEGLNGYSADHLISCVQKPCFW
jgi:hypothetical protein